MFIHWGNKLCVPPNAVVSQNARSVEFLEVQITSRSPKCCMSRNAMSIEFLEVQISPHVLMYDLDPKVSSVKR